MKRLTLLLALATWCAACGASGEHTSAPQAIEPSQPCLVGGAPAPAPPAGERRGALADASQLCQLEIGVSTPQDAKAILGEPDWSNDDGTSASLDYEAGDVTLRLAFAGYVFSYASIDNAPFPSCWSAQIRALIGPDPQP